MDHVLLVSEEWIRWVERRSAWRILILENLIVWWWKKAGQYCHFHSFSVETNHPFFSSCLCVALSSISPLILLCLSETQTHPIMCLIVLKGTSKRRAPTKSPAGNIRAIMTLQCYKLMTVQTVKTNHSIRHWWLDLVQ